MAYKVVLKDDETSVDFDASGEELLIVRHVGADVTLFLLYPDGRGAELCEPLPKMVTSPDLRYKILATVWKGSVPTLARA